jgi:hypothetical protein
MDYGGLMALVVLDEPSLGLSPVPLRRDRWRCVFTRARQPPPGRAAGGGGRGGAAECPFQCSAVFKRRVCFLVHLTICFPESGQMVTANHTPTLECNSLRYLVP